MAGRPGHGHGVRHGPWRRQSAGHRRRPVACLTAGRHGRQSTAAPRDAGRAAVHAGWLGARPRCVERRRQRGAGAGHSRRSRRRRRSTGGASRRDATTRTASGPTTSSRTRRPGRRRTSGLPRRSSSERWKGVRGTHAVHGTAVTRDSGSCGRGVGAILVAVAAAPAHAESARSQQWHLDAMHADEMWKESKGEGVTVAVIDSGVDCSLPDLKGQVLKGKDFVGRHRRSRRRLQQPRYRHGSVDRRHGKAGAEEGIRTGLAPAVQDSPHP